MSFAGRGHDERDARAPESGEAAADAGGAPVERAPHTDSPGLYAPGTEPSRWGSTPTSWAAGGRDATPPGGRDVTDFSAHLNTDRADSNDADGASHAALGPIDDDALTLAALAAGENGEFYEHTRPESWPAGRYPGLPSGTHERGSIWFGVSLCLLLIGVVAAVPHVLDQPIRVGPGDNGQTITAKTGQRITVTMDDGGWRFDSLAEHTALRVDAKTTDDVCAASITMCRLSTLRLQVVGVGSTTVSAVCVADTCNGFRNGDTWSVQVNSSIA